MSDLQFWSIIITAISTMIGQQVVIRLMDRGKLRTDEATALRNELRAENREQKSEIRDLEKRIDELESAVRQFRIMRVDMYRVLQENNVDQSILSKLRILEVG